MPRIYPERTVYVAEELFDKGSCIPYCFVGFSGTCHSDSPLEYRTKVEV